MPNYQEMQIEDSSRYSDHAERFAGERANIRSFALTSMEMFEDDLAEEERIAAAEGGFASVADARVAWRAAAVAAEAAREAAVAADPCPF